MSSAENQTKKVEGPTTASDGKQEFENGNNGEEEDGVKREDGEDEVAGYTKSDFFKIPITVSAPKTEVLNLLFTLDINWIMLCAHGDKHVYTCIYHVILYSKKNSVTLNL